MSDATSHDIPLFPLHAVLFPGGELALRIFEPRYLDLVRDCTRQGSGFGVCLILEGSEAGPPTTSAAVVGTLAHIVDFEARTDGLLGIVARGSTRFAVQRTRVRDNGLVRGDVQFWTDEASVPVPAEYGLLATILERLVEQVGGPYAKAGRACYDDASWVGFRLAELLPLPPTERQQLLQVTDPVARLQQLMGVLPRFQSP